MGYSAKYHALSLMAVFLALAIGVLIGAGFGDSLVEGGADQLQESLSSDLENVQAEKAAVEAELQAEREYSAATFPALVEDRLRDQQISVVSLGGRPADVRNDITAALEPSGAIVNEVVSIRDEIDVDQLAEVLNLDANPLADEEELGEVVRRIARGLTRGDQTYELARDVITDESSGAPGPSDGVIVVLGSSEDEEISPATQLLRENVIEGLKQGGVPVVGVRRTDGNPEATALFIETGLTTVDNVDLIPGRVALVFTLRGRTGNFGVGDGASALIPDLLGIGDLEEEAATELDEVESGSTETDDAAEDQSGGDGGGGGKGGNSTKKRGKQN